MRHREGFGQPNRVTHGAGMLQLREHVVAVAEAIRPFGGEAHAQPPREGVVVRKRLERLSLQRLDTGVVKRRAVLVHPDPAQAEGGLGQRLDVTVGAGCLGLLPQGFTGFAQATSLEQGHPGP